MYSKSKSCVFYFWDYAVSRAAQDEFAVSSYKKAAAAWEVETNFPSPCEDALSLLLICRTASLLKKLYLLLSDRGRVSKLLFLKTKSTRN